MKPEIKEVRTYVHMCTECNSKIQPNWKYCAWCGEKIDKPNEKEND